MVRIESDAAPGSTPPAVPGNAATHMSFRCGLRLESIQHIDTTPGEVLRMTDVRVMQPPIPVQAERPLCVDLDGTLVKSDTLLDSLMVLARRDPAAFLRSPLWAVKGKAH